LTAVSPAINSVSEELAQQGFAIIPAVLPPETVDKLVEEIYDALVERSAFVDYRRIEMGEQAVLAVSFYG